MPNILADSISVTLTAATAGALTCASTVGLFAGQRGWAVDSAGENNLEVIVVSVISGTQFLCQTLANINNGGGADLSAYDGGTFYFEKQLVEIPGAGADIGSLDALAVGAVPAKQSDGTFAAATTANIPVSTDKNYVTDSQVLAVSSLTTTGLLLPAVANNFDPSVSGLYGVIGAKVATLDGETGMWEKTGLANTDWTPLFKKLELAAASASYLDMAFAVPENQGFVVKFERIGITTGGATWATLRLNEKAVSKTPSGSVITGVGQMLISSFGEWDGRACLAGDDTYTNGISKMFVGRAIDGRRQIDCIASHGYSYQYCARFTGVVLVGEITHIGIGVTNLKQGSRIVAHTYNNPCLW